MRAIPLLLAVMVPLVLAAPAGAQSKTCSTLPVKLALDAKDPTTFREEPTAIVSPTGGKKVTALRVSVVRNGKVFARGRLSGTLGKNRRTAISLSSLRRVGEGGYDLQATGKVSGCSGTQRGSRDWEFGRPTLPVRAIPTSTLTGDNVGAVRLILRGVADQRTASVRLSLRDSAGATVSDASASLSGGGATVELPLASALTPGNYVLRMSGSAPGVPNAAPANQPVSFSAGGSGVPVNPTANASKAVVDWSGGQSSGREAAGFVAPGIGQGTVVCRPDAQYIRFYPTSLDHEVAMMNWTYRDWGGGSEKALREALHAPGTGPDFSEGLNKFGPPEKTSTGQFDGIISDRGVFGAPGGSALPPPTTLKLTWVWDFSQSGNERCHAEIELTSQVTTTEPPTVRSAQVVWRGDGNAAGRDTDAVDVPGVGRLGVTCQATPAGTRRLTLEGASGRVTTREASEDFTVAQPSPIVVELPNNGQISIDLDGGRRLLASSRWKVNDPDGAQNSCAIAAQVVGT